MIDFENPRLDLIAGTGMQHCQVLSPVNIRNL